MDPKEDTPQEEGTKQAQSPSAEGSGQERTFTQDEVNAIVQERLKKERAKYEGYEEYRAKAEQADGMAEQMASLEAERDALAAEKAHRELVAKVAAEAGLPAEVVSLLSATEEDALAEQAALLKAQVPAHPARTDDGGGKAAAPRTAAQMFADSLGDIL
ncbi:MAG: DUF4355 domain-containing protein [Atopobiaceae bacterium]|nr:DUF4355 domain-containing protein [Atopobiaceae bacterium]